MAMDWYRVHTVHCRAEGKVRTGEHVDREGKVMDNGKSLTAELEGAVRCEVKKELFHSR